MSKQLANNVYEKRSALQMTQEDLAQAVSVSRQTIIAIEKGNYTPSIALALKLATVFDSNVEAIFWYE